MNVLSWIARQLGYNKSHMENRKIRVALPPTLDEVFQENSEILDRVVVLLEKMRRDRKDEDFSPEEDELLNIGRRLLDNNKKIAKILSRNR